MIRSFEYVGKWYLPDNPEDELYGTLRFTPEGGALLELFGVFERKTVNRKYPMLEPNVILGNSSNGKSITLLGCSETRTQLPLNSEGESTFQAKYILVGALFDKVIVLPKIKTKNRSI